MTQSDVTQSELRLRWSAISDVGRVRKDNQDSGYAGPRLLVVCDGVGGAARGDVASSTAVQVLRRLDEVADGEPLERVAGALHRAHDRIAELAEADEALNGTSTTATVALLHGHSLAVGHVGDSRAYLLRDGLLQQLTHDHTFVQSLVDEGRITEDEARVHPHRNLILKAVDGVRDPDPDLFTVELQSGDRLLLCSDGACGVLPNDTLGALLGDGTPDFAAVELVRASLEAGSTDNVTCVVADVVDAVTTDALPDADAGADAEGVPGSVGAPTGEASTPLPDNGSAGGSDALVPLLVGAAADLPRTAGAGISDTTGRIAPVPGTGSGSAGDGDGAGAPIDAEAARYAPKPPERHSWLRRILVLVTLAGIAWIAVVAAWSWSQQQFYVGESEGRVAIFRGLDATLPGGFELSHPYETTDVRLDHLSEYDADLVREGIEAVSLEKARETVDNLAAQRVGG